MAIIILATMGFVVFALANAQPVGLSFVVGETDVRLIFLVMTSFATGAFAAILHRMVASARHRAQTQNQRNKIRALKQRAAPNQAQLE